MIVRKVDKIDGRVLYKMPVNEAAAKISRRLDRNRNRIITFDDALRRLQSGEVIETYSFRYEPVSD